MSYCLSTCVGGPFALICAPSLVFCMLSCLLICPGGPADMTLFSLSRILYVVLPLNLFGSTLCADLTLFPSPGCCMSFCLLTCSGGPFTLIWPFSLSRRYVFLVPLCNLPFCKITPSTVGCCWA
ncbi:hypothetical protein FA13DRAFT_316541 [Coprinellus micaceus]|uniref:Uncharacterized protein n=1 Tax=Coprinellus micaceus TaxID=71717 RepID=A0A4Y7TCS6_COPMI|nr:hypothetical protein FA13DRAFT_316541 [Coprinellus micaceus]